MKTKLHFNRINMQRNDSRVWSAHTYKSCNSAKEVVIRYKGKIIARTKFKPDGTQPRAWIEVQGNVVFEHDVAVIEVS